jgi:stage II sporulation protein D
MKQGDFFVKKRKLLTAVAVVLICMTAVQGMQLRRLQNKIAACSVQEEGTKEALLPLIVAKEISITAEPEAIRAQCVIARTNLYAAKEQGVTEPTAFTIEELKELWGEQFEEYYEKLQDYVDDTKGQVLTYDGACIYAAYHAVSAGETRDFSESYPGLAKPYLTAAACPLDADAEDFLSVTVLPWSDFWEICQENWNMGQVTEDAAEIQITKRDSAGYALTISVNGQEIEGEAFRKAFNLPSACMTIAAEEENVRIVTKGCGHGFGLSQYTAEQMAKEGKSLKEILSYFYPGSELTGV